ncbi:MAG: Rpn family recombination-promoting nuclease/putative transposase [Clostridiales bacterium]|nr:Rpn family recombination-promoting nuclease/putative transposase [Clostridiales bacterium]
MRETSWKMTEQDRQDALAKLRGLRPIDDDFMRCIFRDNIPLAEFVLRILTGIKDLKVLRLDTQKDLKRLAGARSICLDVTATDNTGRKLDLEIQRSDRGAGSKRARYHSSAMDIENLDAGQDFDELPETYTIFITEKDIFGAGKPFYPVERINMTTGEPFNDGEHILYVNGTYRDDTEIGRLMHDFCCWNADDMQFELMRDITRYFKETEEGVEYMCKAFEETEKRGFERGMQEGVQQGVDMERLRSIKSIMSTFQVSATQAMNSLNIPKEQQAQYAAQL